MYFGSAKLGRILFLEHISETVYFCVWMIPKEMLLLLTYLDVRAQLARRRLYQRQRYLSSSFRRREILKTLRKYKLTAYTYLHIYNSFDARKLPKQTLCSALPMQSMVV